MPCAYFLPPAPLSLRQMPSAALLPTQPRSQLNGATPQRDENCKSPWAQRCLHRQHAVPPDGPWALLLPQVVGAAWPLEPALNHKGLQTLRGVQHCLWQLSHSPARLLPGGSCFPGVTVLPQVVPGQDLSKPEDARPYQRALNGVPAPGC